MVVDCAAPRCAYMAIWAASAPVSTVMAKALAVGTTSVFGSLYTSLYPGRPVSIRNTFVFWSSAVCRNRLAVSRLVPIAADAAFRPVPNVAIPLCSSSIVGTYFVIEFSRRNVVSGFGLLSRLLISLATGISLA